MESMKGYKTFEAWAKVHIRKGDGEKFRAVFNEVNGIEAPKRRRRTKAEMNEEAD